MNSSTSATAAAATDRMPGGIPYIVANEFAERFCYYGINAILAVYMTTYLHFGQAHATSWQSWFKAGAYFFPMLGAVISDALWGKYRTVITFSIAYMVGCIVLAFGPATSETLAVGLGLIAFGTGGIKPCVATNVGDQFTSRNQHLIERAFSYFYLSVNAGSFISIPLCPVLLKFYGPKVAFGVPATMMALATIAFYMGRRRFVVVPPAGMQWLRDVFSLDGLKLALNLAVIYVFTAGFWSLWEQSNGQTWTLQATSDLMDKDIGFGLTLLPSQIQVVNAILILLLVPVFTFGVYPLWARFTKVTPLRKIGLGLFLAALSFMMISHVEARIQGGHVITVWWQVGAYVVLTASEVLVSITSLEFSYKQAPLRMKSFVMALYLLSISAGNATTAVVNEKMVRELPGASVTAGAETWVQLPPGTAFIAGQKVDFGGDTGITVVRDGAEAQPLEGTFLAAEVQGTRIRLMDNDHRRPVATAGTWNAAGGQVSTYRLVGPQYFDFFAGSLAALGVVFIGVAMLYRERHYVRSE